MSGRKSNLRVRRSTENRRSESNPEESELVQYEMADETSCQLSVDSLTMRGREGNRMKLCGHVYEITQLALFVQHYLTNSSRLNPDSIRPVRNARVMFYSWDQVGSRFRSRSLVESNTDETGRYEIDVSVLPDTSVFLVASGRNDAAERSAGHEQKSGCWYRSSPCVPGAIDERPRDIYVARLAIPSESGFSQAELAAVLSETKKQVADLEQITGTITAGGIALNCVGKGARASGRLVLNPDQSGDLTKILRHSIEDFHLELPGPSWLVGLVVSRDAIEASIRTGLRDLAVEINRRLHLRAIALFTDQVRTTNPALAARLADETTLSLGRLHSAPTSGAGPSEASRTIMGEACLGFPRTLERRESRL